MFHICKSKDDKFYVVLVAGNHEALSVNETFEQKESAWRNMVAQLNCFNDAAIWVGDRTVEDCAFYRFEPSGRKETVLQPSIKNTLVNIWLAENQQFYVTVRSHNNQTLSSTETFNHKQSAWVNIQAQMIALGGFMVRVQDNTTENQQQYWLHDNGNKVLHTAHPSKQPNLDK